RASRACYLDRVRALETRYSGEDLDAISRKLRLRDIDFRLDDVLYAKRKIRHRDLLFDPIADAVDVLIVVPGKVQNRFAHGFARNGPGVDTHSTDHLAPFDQRHALAALRALYGSPLACRAGTDHHQIVFGHGRLTLTRGAPCYRLGQLPSIAAGAVRPAPAAASCAEALRVRASRASSSRDPCAALQLLLSQVHPTQLMSRRPGLPERRA